MTKREKPIEDTQMILTFVGLGTFALQVSFSIGENEVAQSCLTLCDPKETSGLMEGTNRDESRGQVNSYETN